MRRTQHIRSEDYPFHIRREGHVRFERVVMLREIYEPLGFEVADVDQIFFIAERTALYHRRTEQIDPLPVPRGIQKLTVGRMRGDARRASAVSREELAVRRD